MEAIIERCAGLDVHQASVVACVLIGEPGRRPRKEVRTFATLTRDLEALRDWLQELGVTHVGMESTGVYWKPVHAVLEGYFELIVGNAHHIRNVPGRKTDVKDAEWVADLIRHGLIKPSFVPPPPIRELRELVRLRRSLSEALTTEQNRTLKLLETANIKLASVVSEVFGVSGRAMLKALVENTATPEAMANLAKRKLRRKLQPLALALDGRLTEHHRYLLAFHLRRVEAIEADLRALDERIEEKAQPFRAQRQLLRQIPGVDDRIAVTILAEIGIDMTVFGNAKRLAAWAGVCPGNYESAGKKKRAATRKGNAHLKTTLVQAAVCAARKKGSYYKDKYHRLKARRGSLRAAMAIGHKILVAAFHILAKGVPFQELGDVFLDQQARKRTTTNLVRRLNTLGYDVVLRPKVTA
ncbi:MAG TPA: IS110 family transposase [Dehalococcoidia bacterium]|nr:IS110 family transposase [Dehalococcoidia bacterium]